jgi:hypothetical protein
MLKLTIVLVLFHVSYSGIIWDNDGQHPIIDYQNIVTNYGDYINSPDEAVKTDWFGLAQNSLDNANDQARRLIDLHHSAKNGIFMMGDGIGLSTVTAGRVFMSQLRNITGDEAVLSWEDMPYMALSKKKFHRLLSF